VSALCTLIRKAADSCVGEMFETIAEFLEPERSSYTWIRAPEKSTPPYIVSDFGRGHCILSHLLSRVG
jgi:hypothetical protein